MENIRVAAIQMNSAIGKIEKNLNSMDHWLNAASQQQMDLVCFPEMCITGYAMPHSREFSESLGGTSVTKVAAMSEEYGISIAAGISEKDDEHAYITQIIVENGEVLGSYRKTHLGEREKLYYDAGRSIEVIDTKKAKIGFQLCWESHFPEISTILALQKADLILMPHASGLPAQRRKDTWDKCLRARAYDNTVYAVACNQIGDNGIGTIFGGGCCAIDPKGNIIAEDYSGCEGMLICDLTPDILNQLRKKHYESMKDLYFLNRRRPELYGNLLNEDL